MKPRKFAGANARDVLRQVKEALGPDALILSNTAVAGGIEVVALAAAAVDELAASVPGAAKPQPAARPAPEDDSDGVNVTLSSAASLRRVQPARAATPRVEPKRFEPRRIEALRAEAPRTPAPRVSAPVAPPVPAPAPVAQDSLMQNMMNEIRSMRSLMEEQLAELAWSDLGRRDPVKLRVLRTLLSAGFSADLARRLIDRMPDGCVEADAAKWLHAEINRNLDVVASDNDIIDRGGVYAIVGPTGVGKTTTAAKLAARCVVRHGADKIALLTTDGYRIGAHEQLRIYGKILGVAVHAIKDTGDLRLALSELRGKHMVLIDTIGMSQRDKAVAEQVAMLSGCGGDVKRLLLLNATCSGDTLEDVVQAYRGDGLAGCVLTKIDEAAGAGAVLDVIMRHRLPLHYVANGQRVPEDLHLANRQYLIHRALKTLPPDSPYALADHEFPLLMAAHGARPAARRTQGARLG
jgi:flagellar biosynthesis protein FlhF